MQGPQTFFLVNAREDGSLKQLKEGTTSRHDVRAWFGNSEAVRRGDEKDLRPRVDPVGIPTRWWGARFPYVTTPLPARS